MNKLTDTKNFIIKYLILELFEKLYRLRKYTETCGRFDRKNNNDKIIALFRNSITIIGSEIHKLCAEIDTDLTDDDKFTYILKISQHSQAIVKIHEELKNLHSSWILPEIKTFTNEIIGDKVKRKHEINIILSDHYSFLESNLGKKFEKSLSKVYLRSDESEKFSDNHSFILPKIEFSNPLNWTIIVHEAGHLQNATINGLRSNPDIMPDEIEAINEQKIKNWAEEIFCDIYATSLLGPGYFLSFVSFALLSTTDYGISAYSDIHPSVIIRASIMINYLRDNKLIFDSSWDWGGEDYSDLFYKCLLEQHSIFNDEATKSVKGLTKFNRNLRKIIKDLNLSNFSIDESDAKRIRKLIQNLDSGTPIGSISDKESVNINQELKKVGLTKDKLLELKDMVSERSCKIWEILNAGWIYKLEYSCKRGMEIFFDAVRAEDNIDSKINEYGEIVDFLDDRLLSSINTSQIIKIIEGN